MSRRHHGIAWGPRRMALPTVPELRLILVPGLMLMLCLCLTPRAAHGQQQSLTDVLGFLVTNQSVPTGDFVKDAESARVTRETITRSLLVELATLPISSSSPAFVYHFNRELGTLERPSDSFGPFFAERSLTAGEGQVSFGVNLRLAHFTHLDGQDLGDGQFVTSANIFRDEAQPFDLEALTLDLDARTLTGSVNVGLTDRFDVSAAVPFVSISLSGTRVNTYRGQVLMQARADAQSTGIGDIALRAKYRLFDGPRGGLAAVAEIRLPTGDADNLLGAGKTSYRALAVASLEPGRFDVDVNGGFAVGGLSHELHYRTAASFSAAPRVTLVGELLGRRLDDVGRITAARAAHPTFANVETIRLIAAGDAMHAASMLGGVKWNVTGTWLLSGSVSKALGGQGLRPGAVLQVGLDYAWTP
jgi:hypothetical protein